MYEIIKRTMDFFLSLLAIIILSPLFLLVILVLKVTGEGEVFYAQKRIGLNTNQIQVYKFVTMRKNSESKGSITYKNDPRILPVGRILRYTKINELPQLFNIVNGTMSIVGPRPLVDSDSFQYYPEILKPYIYKDNKPGLTGIGSLFFRNEEEILVKTGKSVADTYKEDIMPIKGKLELWYRENKNIWTDIKIIFLTALAVVFPNNNLHLKAFKSLPPHLIEAYTNLRN